MTGARTKTGSNTKFLAFSSDYHPGGMVKRFTLLLSELPRFGCSIDYLCFEDLGIASTAVLFRPVQERKPFPLPPYLQFITPAFFKALQLMREQRYDCIITFNTFDGLIGAAIATFVRIPLIVFIRGDPLQATQLRSAAPLKIQVTKIIERWVYASAKGIIVNSKTLEKINRQRYGLPPEKFAYVPNNILSRFQTRTENIFLDHERPYLAFIGPLDPIKNIDLFLEAYAQIAESIDYDVFIIGDSPWFSSYRLELEQYVNDRDLEDRIHFLGHRTDIPKLLSSVELLVLPSRSEGCPNVILEALGIGTPCIGADIPPIRELLSYDELLFEANSANAIENKLRTILEPDRLAHLRKLCQDRRRAFDFDWGERCFNTIQAILQG